MKCPKCGFTSFDHLDNCRKCGNDLQNFKARHGVRSVLLAGLTGGIRPAVDEVPVAEGAVNLDRKATDFGFDFPVEGTVNAPVAPDRAHPVITGEETEFEATPAPSDLVLAEDAAEMEPGRAGEVSVEPPSPEEFSEPGDHPDARAFDFGGEGEELPPLNLETVPTFAGQGIDPSPLEEDELFLDWGELDLEAARDAGQDAGEEKPKPPADQEDPPDPFDLRGFTAAGGTPALPDLPKPDPAGAADPAMDRLIASFDDFSDAPPGREAGPSLPYPPDEFLLPGNDLAAAPPEVESPPAPGATSPLDLPAEAAEFHPDSDEEEGLPAPLVSRLAASIADLLILAAVFLLFLALGQWLLHADDSGSLLPPAGSLLRLSIPYFLVLFTGSFGYFTFFHFLLGQTPGKMLFGLAVEGLGGESLTFAQAFLRSAGGLASLCLAGIGYAAALFDDEGRGWNDRLAGSRVVLWTRENEDVETEDGSE